MAAGGQRDWGTNVSQIRIKWMTAMALLAVAAGSAALACGGSAGSESGTSKLCAREVLAAAPSGYYSATYAISDKVENCSTEDETVEVEFSFKHDGGTAGAACPADSPSQKATAHIPAGTTGNLSISAAMPNCPGATYSVTADATSGGTRLTSSTLALASPSSGGGGSKGGGATGGSGGNKGGGGGGADDGSPHP
jgi:hypothetical protein